MKKKEELVIAKKLLLVLENRFDDLKWRNEVLLQ